MCSSDLKAATINRSKLAVTASPYNSISASVPGGSIAAGDLVINGVDIGAVNGIRPGDAFTTTAPAAVQGGDLANGDFQVTVEGRTLSLGAVTGIRANDGACLTAAGSVRAGSLSAGAIVINGVSLGAVDVGVGDRAANHVGVTSIKAGNLQAGDLKIDGVNIGAVAVQGNDTNSALATAINQGGDHAAVTV